MKYHGHPARSQESGGAGSPSYPSPGWRCYDYEGRLTQITYPTSATNTFSYNALDARTQKVDSAGTFDYKRDGVDPVSPVLSDSAAGYTPGVSERRSSTTKFYHEDQLGSVTRLTNTSQTTTDTRQYDAFGNVVSASGSTPTPFGFVGTAGYQSDADSGLMLLGHRYYDPSTGRFITRDPVKDGRNWYLHCGSNPMRIDPSGFWGIRLDISFGVIVGALFGGGWGSAGVGISIGSHGIHGGLFGSLGGGAGLGAGFSAGPGATVGFGEEYGDGDMGGTSGTIAGFLGWEGGGSVAVNIDNMFDGPPDQGGGGVGGGHIGPTFGGGIFFGGTRTWQHTLF